MKPITFSQLERVDACPASQHLPWAEDSGEAAEYGTGQHSRLQALREHGVVPTEKGDIDLSGVVQEGDEAEIAYAIRVEDGKVKRLGRLASPRAYPELGDGWIVGTLDLSQLGRVGELKTGQGDVKSPKENLQVRAQAYCVADHNGCTEATIYIRRKDGFSADLPAHFDEFDNLSTLSRLQDIWGRAQKASHQDVVREGVHCTYCPARLACPAKRARITALVANGNRSISITKDNEADIYLRFRAAKGLIEGLETDIKAHTLSSGPIDLGDGREYGPTSYDREGFDGEKVFDVLTSLYGPLPARAAVNFTTSKALLEATIERFSLPRDRVFEALSNNNAIKKVTVEQFREHKRKAG